MLDREPVETFDLPDSCGMDRVAIYPNDDPEEPDFQAVPFYLADVFQDGTKHYDEPLDFDVTVDYRQAVEEKAGVSFEEIRLKREIPTYSYEPV